MFERTGFRKAFARLATAAAVIFPICFVAGAVASPSMPVGLGPVVVHPKFGGEILGFGIDPSGTEGLLSEFITLQDGKYFIATETFDQKTGKILEVLGKKNNTNDNYGTWGAFGQHVGLDEFYQNGTNSFPVLDPLNANKFSNAWTPQFLQGYYLSSIAGNLNTANVAVLTFENGGNLQPSVFASNIAANTFGPQVAITDNEFCSCTSPVIALDTATNQAVLASSYGATPAIALADLTTAAITKFAGVGYGFVSGIAVDPAKGLAVTTTVGAGFEPAGVQFYDLKKQTGFQVIPPCSDGGEEGAGGAYVAFDPDHSLFLVEQPYNTCNGGSNIIVYDEKGDVVETLTGFQILPISPTLIALHPKDRTGFVFSDRTASGLQSFSY